MVEFIKIEFRNLKENIMMLEKLPKIIEKKGTQSIKKLGDKLVSKLRIQMNIAGWGGGRLYYKGTLYNKTQAKAVGKDKLAVSMPFYWRLLETGHNLTYPKMPPALKGWLRSKGIEEGFMAAYRKKGEYHFEPRPFVNAAFDSLVKDELLKIPVDETKKGLREAGFKGAGCKR